MKCPRCEDLEYDHARDECSTCHFLRCPSCSAIIDDFGFQGVTICGHVVAWGDQGGWKEWKDIRMEKEYYAYCDRKQKNADEFLTAEAFTVDRDLQFLLHDDGSPEYSGNYTYFLMRR